MHIGINTLFLIPGEVGGSQTYLTEILLRLARVAPRHELTLFANTENLAFLRELLADSPHVKLDALNVPATSRPRRIICEQFALPARVRAARPDVLWSPGYTAPVILRTPQVVSILDMQYKEFPLDLSFAARVATDILVRAAARRSDLILTLSEFGRDQVVKYTSAPAERVRVTHLAAGDRFFRAHAPADIKNCTERLLRSTAPYILCTSNTYPHKNVHALVEAFGLIAGERPDTLLVLVGKPGRGEAATRRAISSLVEPNRVRRLADVSPDDLAMLYQGAAAFAFPSLYEGFGIPLLEAMAAGTPVVAADREPMREIAQQCVRYFDGSAAGLAGALRGILSLGKQDRRGLIAKARERAAAFSWDRTTRATLTCLADAAGLPADT